MKQNNGSIAFLYGTVPGRALLRLLLACGFPRLAAAFLRAGVSRRCIAGYAAKHDIPAAEYEGRDFRSFRDFFIRRREEIAVDRTPETLISPCDGFLSVFPVTAEGVFSIKNSHYRLADLLQDPLLARRYEGGLCAILRLCPSDYHRYCYIDDGYQRENHSIPGTLHSVQPIACATYPVYVLNRRAWTLLETEHFGSVVQTEIGAMAVGGIVNHRENCAVSRGEEKGYFDLAGSTITLLFEPGRVSLPQIPMGEERRVSIGEKIGEAFA